MTEQTPVEPAAPEQAPPAPAAADGSPSPSPLAEKTQSFAPRHSQPAPWNAPATPASDEARDTGQKEAGAPAADSPRPRYALGAQGATSPVPSPLATQAFMPVQPQVQPPSEPPSPWAAPASAPAAPAAAEVPRMPPGGAPAAAFGAATVQGFAPVAQPGPASPPPSPPQGPAPTQQAFGSATIPGFAPVGQPGPAPFPAPPTQAPPVAPAAQVAAPPAPAQSQQAAKRRPLGSPKLPPRPPTLKAAFIVAAVQTFVFVAAGGALLILANGTGDWLQRRLDDYNKSHTRLTIDAFQHGLDVIGTASIAIGVVVVLLASSAALYGQLSRWLLVGLETLVVAAGAVGLVVSVASAVFLPLPIAVIALMVAPPTRRAFAEAGDALEEWRSP